MLNEVDLEKFPESIRDWDEIKNSDTPEIFWDRIKNLRSKFGTGLFKPGEEAGSEDWGKFTNKAIELSGERLMPKPDLEDEEQRKALFKTLGKPDEESGYEFAEIEGAPSLSDERKAFLTKMAFDANLTKAQLKSLDTSVRGADFAALQDAQVKFNDGLKNLKLEWGLATDDRVNTAIKIAKTFFPHLGDNPNLSAEEIRSFHSIAKQLGSPSTEFKQQGDQGLIVMTPDDASIKIDEIRNNKEHPYHDTHSSGHAAAKKKMRSLYLIKNGLPPE